MDFAKLLLSFILLVTANQAYAAKCVSQKEMSEIAAHFTQFKNLAGKEYCYDGSNTAYLIEGLMFMRETQFASAMPKSQDELFSGAFTSDWWKYFIGRINKMSIQTNCPKGAAAYVTMFSGKTMYVCPLMLTPSFSALDRASIFMHEARHIDGYPHTTCTQGPRKGIQGACDDRISSKGSYAVTVETYAQLGKYATDLHPALMAYSRASAVIYADEAFDVPVKINRQNQFLLMTKSQQFHGFDASAPTKGQQLGQAPELGQLIVRATHYILFPDDKTKPAAYVFTEDEGSIEQAPGADAVAYNNMTPAQKAELVGIHYGGQWGARVYKNRISYTCDVGASPVEKTLSSTPVAILYPNGYSRSTFTAHLQMGNGQVMEFGCTNKSPMLQNTNVNFDRLFKRLYKSGNVVLGLGLDGQLYQVQNGNSTLLANPLNGQIHDLAPNQTFAFFQN